MLIANWQVLRGAFRSRLYGCVVAKFSHLVGALIVCIISQVEYLRLTKVATTICVFTFRYTCIYIYIVYIILYYSIL